MYPNILNKSQLAIVKKLKLPAPPSFYLAGGTALALQIGHRTSIDFDFYSQKNFTSSQLAQHIKKTFPNAKALFIEEDTLKTAVGKTELSFFYYSYEMLEPFSKFQSLHLASLADIGAMKLAAIVQRGTKRDFIDIYYLLKTYSLQDLITFALRKYPSYHNMLILRSLIYFEDAEGKDTHPLEIFDSTFSWRKAKSKIFQEVKKYQLAMFAKY